MTRPLRALLALPWALSACAGSPDEGAAPTASAIRHLVVIVQENHTFDNYFGRYCTAAPGTDPACTTGPACCEAAPDRDPGTGAPPTALTDQENAGYTPSHDQRCEIDEINGGRMDRFVSSAICGSPRNFALAPREVAQPYWDLAGAHALADHYFQPTVGASSANDMYLARARFVFPDNDYVPASIGARCTITPSRTMAYTDPTIGDLLAARGVPWAFYAEGYQAMIDADRQGRCPDPPDECAASLRIYPCVFDPGDVPFQYYPAFRDDPVYMRDLARLTEDLEGGALPAVSFVKPIGYRSEHPGLGTDLRAGTAFVTALVGQLLGSRYAQSTLILLAYDEGGGYFDHVPPPPPSGVDGQPYGTRLPFLAIGPFARRNHVSHAPLEHSSIVRFIEWNWLGGQTGQLGTRDAVVNNLGSLLDPASTGVPVPER